jgi:hypothetical protein
MPTAPTGCHIWAFKTANIAKIKLNPALMFHVMIGTSLKVAKLALIQGIDTCWDPLDWPETCPENPIQTFSHNQLFPYTHLPSRTGDGPFRSVNVRIFLCALCRRAKRNANMRIPSS